MVDLTSIGNVIELALFRHIETMPFGSVEPLPFAWVNEDFEPPASQRYIEVKHFPNEPINYAFGGVVGIRQGFLQASIYWERNGGTFEPGIVAGLVAARFPLHLKIRTSEFAIVIYRPPTIASVVTETADGKRSQPFIPVTIYYRTETL